LRAFTIESAQLQPANMRDDATGVTVILTRG
jgi:hypothetical protein